jgi:predicted Zn-dependent peptidase
MKARFNSTLLPSSFLFLAAFLTAPPFLSAAAEVSKFLSLDNGLRVYLLEKRDVPLLNVVTAVNLGSKDETAETNGLVHILEHCILFRGRVPGGGGHGGLAARRHGAYFNAHTDQDLSLFEISLPAAEADFAFRHQRDLLFGLELADAELASEKEIILEELSMLEDDAVRLGVALVQQSVFRGHPYERPIYGSRDIIRAVTADTVRSFYKSYFVPSNAVMALVGDFALADMEAKVRAAFGDLPKVPFEPARYPKAARLEKPVERTEVLDVSEATLVLGWPAPDADHPDQYALDVLTEVCGRGVNPMLNGVLRGGRRELVKTLSMSYFSRAFGGVVLLIMTLDPANVGAAKRQAVDFMRRARNLNFAKSDVYGEEQFYAFDYLGSAKNQIRFATEAFRESGLNVARSLAKYLLFAGPSEGTDYLAAVDKLTSSDLRQAAARVFSAGSYAAVAILPKSGGDELP